MAQWVRTLAVKPETRLLSLKPTEQRKGTDSWMLPLTSTHTVACVPHPVNVFIIKIGRCALTRT